LVQQHRADVIIAGAGPAGSTLAWALAREGVDALVLDRARFPREKVCGDYVDPRGLQVLAAMGCLGKLKRALAQPVRRTATHVEWERHFDGPIPFYGAGDRLPAYGLTIPRSELDAQMLRAAQHAGATVHEQTEVKEVSASRRGVEVRAVHGSRKARYRARLIAGADGVNSLVARSQGLLPADATRTVVARRAYAVVGGGAKRADTAEIFFDESLFPGYGWMFPARGGRVNLGIGLLSETQRRRSVQIPSLFDAFVEGLRRHHPRCGELELCSKPIGGVVRTYGAAGRNCFDGGVLVGDAGSFVDPMTGEGITQGMESALLAAPALIGSLESGAFDAESLSSYEAGFRAYFDPSMSFLDLCAVMLRNRHLARPWLKALAQGCRLATEDSAFARTSGSFFGGMEIRPIDILGQVWTHTITDALLAWPRFLGLAGGPPGRRATSPGDLLEWQGALWRSALSEPRWHARWLFELQQSWSDLLATASGAGGDPRAEGLLTGAA
jgi:geranylgeranyl reductase family protein